MLHPKKTFLYTLLYLRSLSCRFLGGGIALQICIFVDREENFIPSPIPLQLLHKTTQMQPISPLL